MTGKLKLRSIKWWPCSEELDDAEMGVRWAIPAILHRSLIVFEGGGLDVCVCVCVYSLYSTSFPDYGDRDVSKMDFSSRFTWLVT